MRFLRVAAWALLLMLGLGSPAGAEDILIEARPGLTIRTGDGRLSRHGQRTLIRAEEGGWLKEWLAEKLAYVGSDSRYAYPLFDLAGQVELSAANQDKAMLRFFREPAGPLAVYVVVPSLREPAADDQAGGYPIRLRLRLDGRDLESGHWGQVRTRVRPPAETLLVPGWTLDRDGREQARTGFLAALRPGRALTVEGVLKSGETVAADFDLTGLAEALDLMEAKMAESLRAVGPEIEKLKKRLAELD